jgi:HEPN domain-containing protein
MSAETDIARQWIAKARSDLLMLLELILPFSPTAEGLRASLVILTPYSVATRYPDDETGAPSLVDAKEARQCANRVCNWLADEMPEIGQE